MNAITILGYAVLFGVLAPLAALLYWLSIHQAQHLSGRLILALTAVAIWMFPVTTHTMLAVAIVVAVGEVIRDLTRGLYQSYKSKGGQS